MSTWAVATKADGIVHTASTRKEARAYVDALADVRVKRNVVRPQFVELHVGDSTYYLGTLEELAVEGWITEEVAKPRPQRKERKVRVPRPKPAKPRGRVTDPDCLPHGERLAALALLGAGDPATLTVERAKQALRVAADNRDPVHPFSKDTCWVEVDGVRVHHDVLARHLLVRCRGSMG